MNVIEFRRRLDRETGVRRVILEYFYSLGGNEPVHMKRVEVALAINHNFNTVACELRNLKLAGLLLVNGRKGSGNNSTFKLNYVD